MVELMNIYSLIAIICFFVFDFYLSIKYICDISIQHKRTLKKRVWQLWVLYYKFLFFSYKDTNFIFFKNLIILLLFIISIVHLIANFSVPLFYIHIVFFELGNDDSNFSINDDETSIILLPEKSYFSLNKVNEYSYNYNFYKKKKILSELKNNSIDYIDSYNILNNMDIEPRKNV